MGKNFRAQEKFLKAEKKIPESWGKKLDAHDKFPTWKKIPGAQNKFWNFSKNSVSFEKHFRSLENIFEASRKS